MPMSILTEWFVILIAEIGYTNTEYGFSAETVGVHPSLVEQSPDIAQGVNEALEVRGMRIKIHLT